ncbi:MAG: CvpA family protein [Streptococcaceae bacterium]|jgi:uncharacterized membrane protein required for colicin V production|nr:CvpA family protein [Streptococcaceae bacterium]
MIVTIGLGVVLFLGYLRGYRRGLFWELFEVFGTIVSAILAASLYQNVSAQLVKQITLTTADSPALTYFSNQVLAQIKSPLAAMLSFSLIFFLSGLILRLLSLILRPIARKITFGKLGRFLAGLLAAAMTYVSLQVVLTLLSLVPNASVQSLLASSPFAHWMIFDTPLSSQKLLQLIIGNTLHIPYTNL